MGVLAQPVRGPPQGGRSAPEGVSSLVCALLWGVQGALQGAKCPDRGVPPKRPACLPVLAQPVRPGGARTAPPGRALQGAKSPEGEGVSGCERSEGFAPLARVSRLRYAHERGRTERCAAGPVSRVGRGKQPDRLPAPYVPQRGIRVCPACTERGVQLACLRPSGCAPQGCTRAREDKRRPLRRPRAIRGRAWPSLPRTQAEGFGGA